MESLAIQPSTMPALPRNGAALFRGAAQRREVARHSSLFVPGARADQVYLVEFGEVRVTRYTDEGRELTLEHLGPGGLLGETDVLLGRPREAEAVARTDCVVSVLSPEPFLALLAQEPAFALWLSQQTSGRQARMESRLETLLFKSANGKVAQVLLNLATTHGERTQGGTLIDYPITHQEIGNLIATTRETVSYAFMEFRQRGLISTRQRKTVVHDLDALGDVARN